jgi:hypothetical protein
MLFSSVFTGPSPIPIANISTPSAFNLSLAALAFPIDLPVLTWNSFEKEMNNED